MNPDAHDTQQREPYATLERATSVASAYGWHPYIAP